MNSPAFIFRGALGALISIGLIGWLAAYLPGNWVLLVGSFGASAVIVFSLPRAKTAQPKALFFGNMFGVLVGLSVVSFIPLEPWFLAALAVSGAIAIMGLTHTVHPPGGAAALIAVLGIPGLGNQWYLAVGVFVGATILYLTAMVIHNLPGPGRVPYPGDHADDAKIKEPKTP